MLNDAISLKIKIREKKRGRQGEMSKAEVERRERRERRDGPTDLDENGLDAIVAVPVGENG